MLSLVFPLFALCTFASGAVVMRRATLGPCDGLGSDTTAIRHNFTLSAINQTLPNANNSGLPLVLALDAPDDGTQSLVFRTLATWNSYPLNEWPDYSMDNGVIVANSYDGEPPTVAVQSVDDSEVLFVTTRSGPQPTAAPNFCSVEQVPGMSPPNNYPYLAMNNRYDLFSICQALGQFSGQWRVIYNVTYGVGSPSFDVSTCFLVYLQIIGAGI